MTTESLVRSRVYAWLIDVAIALGLGSFVPPLSWAVGTAYWLFRDGLFDGQSVGKRLMGLTVVRGETRAPCTWAGSVGRNLLWAIPIVNLAMAVTTWRALTHAPDGRHWGDRLADTQVVSA